MSTQKRPAEKFSTAELLKYRRIAEQAIIGANKKINGQGGWIARESNWDVINRATNDIKIIDEELSYRK